ncbi:PAS domain-containing sensor histidine kinase [Zeaxanthinibacter enoshimensis]|uniref:histidine kinase n=1 Tax=Zeaxanthinibacter enoshimensis TaxID=392009 RepID=A0A4R6TI74_9FLAO|nr:PAS domain-containing sensor histidine kinase [Zeaxanthinibacter enoshimensis]TDQ28940.1 PAS domain S-box-containing protein [Zeaxanthinibacter enoshimensis]
MRSNITTGAGYSDSPEKAQAIATSYGTDILDNVPAAIYTCDTQGRVTYFNKAAAELWGREPELHKDLWCGSWKIFTTEGENLPLDDCPMAIVLKNEATIPPQEIVVERPDGKRRNVMVHPKMLYDANGTAIGAINMLQDITEKKKQEVALKLSESNYRKLAEYLEKKVEERTTNLKQSEQRYHRMVEEVQDYAIILLDPEGNILNWNKGAEQIKGYKESEIIGKNYRLFYREEDRKALLPEKLVSTAILDGRSTHEGWRVKKDGSQFWGSVVITALHDDEGQILGFSKVTRDLTERKLAEDQKEKYARDIEVRNTQLEEYAHIASHDLQEPLRKVQVFSDLVKSNLDNKEKAILYLDRMRNSAQRMATLIKDVLKYSKVSDFDEFFDSVDLNEVLTNVKEDFNLLLEEKQVKLTASNLPTIEGIPVQIHQLLSNLLGNAIKFSIDCPEINISSTEASKAELEEFPELDPTKSHIKLRVSDNGVGFEPQYSEAIFTMFKRLRSDAQGNGIGLTLCKKIVENHKGKILVESSPGAGTTFTIYLPKKYAGKHAKK